VRPSAAGGGIAHRDEPAYPRALADRRDDRQPAVERADAHRIEGVVATELPGSKRHIYAATYGEPPDPPATAALLAALAEAATRAFTG